MAAVRLGKRKFPISHLSFLAMFGKLFVGLDMESMAKSIVSALSIVLAMCPMLSAQAQRGTICVAPNSSKPPARISPGGDYNPATLSVKVDNGRLLLWPHKESVIIRDLDLNRRHLVALTSDGKRIQSFWFRFSEYKSNDLCVSFDGYQGVNLQERKRSPWCKCK
jgi:hypothetical protein